MRFDNYISSLILSVWNGMQLQNGKVKRLTRIEPVQTRQNRKEEKEAFTVPAKDNG